MTSIAPENKSPYLNLLRAADESDRPIAWVTLGPCTGDDNPRIDSNNATEIEAGQSLGPCVGDDGPVCDQRLKTDVCPVGTLPNGLQLYSFKYWNDDQTFVCVMAQDLLEDERFSHAVSEGDGGYYRVNLAALGLSIAGSQERFREAGRRAAQEASPIVN